MKQLLEDMFKAVDKKEHIRRAILSVKNISWGKNNHVFSTSLAAEVIGNSVSYTLQSVPDIYIDIILENSSVIKAIGRYAARDFHGIPVIISGYWISLPQGDEERFIEVLTKDLQDLYDAE